MAKSKRKSLRSKRTVKGKGLVSSALSGVRNIAGTVLNKGIDLLPFEAHLPAGISSGIFGLPGVKRYNYCGPGTRLKERLARGDKPINGLDEACRTHDIAYAKYSDSANRARADKDLAERAWRRFKSSDASVGEKAAAWAVTTAMKVKSKLGGGKKLGGGRRKRRQVKRKQSKKGKGLYLRPYKEGSGRCKKRRVNKKKACRSR